MPHKSALHPPVGRLPRGINIERRDRQVEELGLGLH
jgi:hypothetical protein